MAEEKYADAVVLALNVSMMATLGGTHGAEGGNPELVWLKSFASGPLMDRTEYAYAVTFDRNGVVHVSGTTQGKGKGWLITWCTEGRQRPRPCNCVFSWVSFRLPQSQAPVRW